MTGPVPKLRLTPASEGPTTQHGEPSLLGRPGARSVGRCRIAAALVALLALVPDRSAAQAPRMLVYLPGAAVESPARLAGAVTDLAAYLNRQIPGLNLEVEAFRRAEDAVRFFEAKGQDVIVVVSEPAFLLDFPPGFDAVPMYRFVRSGRETQQKLVVVKANQPALRSLVGLRGRTLSLALGTGQGSAAFLAHGVFAGELVPDAWFGAISPEPDDSSAIASVLFGRADAALVSEHNPLLATHLGQDLREVYVSPPVSMPVVAVRPSDLGETQRTAMDRALDELGRSAQGPKVLAGLGIDSLRRIAEGDGPLERAGLLRLAAARSRTPAIALPPPSARGFEPLPGLKPEDLPFVVDLELVDLPLPSRPVREQEARPRETPRP